jgi:hypothetical protein
MSVFAGRVTSGSVMVTRVTFHQLAEAKIGIGAKLLYITTENNLPYSFHPTRANNKKEVIVMHWSKEVEEYLTRHYADLLV